MQKLLLNGSDWTVSGWTRHHWKKERAMETNTQTFAVVSNVNATVPGSVQTDLLNAGLIEDWNYETNFINIEWIENREWIYNKKFTVNFDTKKYYLHLDGVDFYGHVYINGALVYNFGEMHLRHCVDITDNIIKNGENDIKVIFLQPPEVDGQIGYTSKVSILKSRFNYGWDWCPRLVNIGIFNDIYIECTDNLRVTDFFVKTDIVSDKGVLTSKSEIQADNAQKITAKIIVSDNNTVIGETQKELEISAGNNTVELLLENLDVNAWFPNGFGKQPLYTAELLLLDESGKKTLSETKRVGFRKLEYAIPCDAPEGCLKYNVMTNGKNVNIRGVNWVPISAFYGSVTEEQYRYYIGKFADMGCNLLRVWGGALREKDVFYEICDELGMMVWQEFPQSSSGIDNCTNESPEFIENLRVVAKEYILRTRSYTCLTFWCGGNELYLTPDYCPVDEFFSQNIKMLNDTVKELNPEVEFVPASPSRYITGKEHVMGEEDYVFCDAHGPWDYQGPEGHYHMVPNSESVLFSEVGAPGVARPETLNKYCKSNVWPPDYSNRYWTQRGLWWIRYKEYTELFGDFEDFEDKVSVYSAASRFIQAEALRYTAEAIRSYGSKKSGIIIWMAGEPFPNTSNTSLIEYDGCAKPAYYQVRKAFSNLFVGLEYISPIADIDGIATAKIFACADTPVTLKNINLRVYNLTGKLLQESTWGNITVDGELTIDTVNINTYGETVIARVEVPEYAQCNDEWVFVPTNIEPFRALITADKAKLKTKLVNGNEIVIKNTSLNTISLFNEIIASDENGEMVNVYPNYFSLLPGESCTCFANKPIDNFTVIPLNQK